MEEEIRFYFSYDKYEELLEKLKKNKRTKKWRMLFRINNTIWPSKSRNEFLW